MDKNQNKSKLTRNRKNFEILNTLANKKDSKGITLSILVVTIIILLILAGITISTVGDNGNIKHTITASDKYTRSEEQEIMQVAYSALLYKSEIYDVAMTEDKYKEEINNNRHSNNVTVLNRKK